LWNSLSEIPVLDLLMLLIKKIVGQYSTPQGIPSVLTTALSSLARRAAIALQQLRLDKI
jgi:hypothetical protein